MGLSHGNSRELNDAERAKLNELIVASKALLTPVDEDLSSLIGEDCLLNVKEYFMLNKVNNSSIFFISPNLNKHYFLTLL